jgi:hypothetical protein
VRREDPVGIVHYIGPRDYTMFYYNLMTFYLFYTRTKMEGLAFYLSLGLPAWNVPAMPPHLAAAMPARARSWWK